MDADQLTQVERVAQFTEKYGLSLIFLLLAVAALVLIVRMIIRGDLVPRWMLDKSEEAREEAAETTKELGEAVKEIRDFLSRIKVRDDHEGSG